MAGSRSSLVRLVRSPAFGLAVLIVLIALALGVFAPPIVDRTTGASANGFLNAATLIRTAKDASLFAIMAVGATLVIVTGGIDLSVGSIYALASVATAAMLRYAGPLSPASAILLGLAIACLTGMLCGLLNGVAIASLRVHPFVITLGAMWIFRGIAFVTTKAESIPVPESLTSFAKASLGLSQGTHPVPMLFMAVVGVLGTIYLGRTIWGRRSLALGGSERTTMLAGISVGGVRIQVFALAGLLAGLAAFVGASYYGAASSADGNGYELYVIASAVVGGASLAGGRGTAMGAVLGALLIALLQQAIMTLRLDQNYQWILIGSAIIAAVVIDQATFQRRAAGQR